MVAAAKIRPIETRYKGQRFRSRLEARWAVFFDTLNVIWRYECEGYDLGRAGYYLPDFYLPEPECFIEVKPNRDSCDHAATLKCAALSLLHSVVLVQGDFPEVSADVYWGGAWHDSDHAPCICPKCGQFGFTYSGWAHRLPCECFDEDHRCKAPHTWPAIEAAYLCAAGARFEHGEAG